MNVENIKAYDYLPSISTMLIDHWRRVSQQEIRAELIQLKQQHPEMNAVRIMHAFEAYQRSPKEYCKRYEERLAVCEELGLKVVCCLFNRWHDPKEDCGGTYLEHLIPDLSWAYHEGFYENFVQDVCVSHCEDERIVLWETCNKPLGVYLREEDDPIMARFYEKRWLRELYCYIKKCELPQPVGISYREDYNEETLAHLKRCCDVAICSPYYANPEKTAHILAHSFDETGMPVLKIL